MPGSSDETAGHRANASTLHIHSDKTQIGTARSFVQLTLGTWGLSTQTAELQIAASELVTNAIMHGEGGVDVTLLRLADRLRLEVVDEGFGPRPIQIRDANATSHGGWGLRLVEGLSDGWAQIVDPDTPWSGWNASCRQTTTTTGPTNTRLHRTATSSLREGEPADVVRSHAHRRERASGPGRSRLRSPLDAI